MLSFTDQHRENYDIYREHMLTELTSITPDRIDPDAEKVIRRLRRFGFEAYLVGGCVRDLLLGRTPKDFDVATNATPTEIKQTFRNCRIIGRRFRLAHIFFGKKIIETSTFRSSPRNDLPADGEELIIWRDNNFGTAEEDALRRDFTVNGLFYDLITRQVIDFVGGQADLRQHRVQTIGDPRIRFQEDPVRILRAVKFAARLGFSIDPATELAMIEFRGLISKCSVARVLEEIYRLLSTGHLVESFELMHRTGVLGVLFPELHTLLGPPSHPLARIPVLPFQGRRVHHRPITTSATNHGSPTQSLEEPSLPTIEPKPPMHISPEEILLATEKLVARMLGRDIKHRQLAICWLWNHLQALDQWITYTKEPPTHAFLLGTLLIGLAQRALNRGLSSRDATAMLKALVEAVADRLRISRKDRERLLHLLTTQRLFLQLDRRSHPQSILRHEYFVESLQLFELHSTATGRSKEAVNHWKQMQPIKTKRKKRRKRRHDFHLKN